MTKLQGQVLEFMRAFQQDAAEPGVERIPSWKTFGLGMNLIKEEFGEYQNAKTDTERKDALGDLLYVSYWMANAHGFVIRDCAPYDRLNCDPSEFINDLERSETMPERYRAISCLIIAAYSLAAYLGFEMEPITDEIHRSNMSKMWTEKEIAENSGRFFQGSAMPDALKVLATIETDGPRKHVVIRVSDGKVIKSPSYSKAQL